MAAVGEWRHTLSRAERVAQRRPRQGGSRSGATSRCDHSGADGQADGADGDGDRPPTLD